MACPRVVGKAKAGAAQWRWEEVVVEMEAAVLGPARRGEGRITNEAICWGLRV